MYLLQQGNSLMVEMEILVALVEVMMVTVVLQYQLWSQKRYSSNLKLQLGPTTRPPCFPLQH